MKIKIVDEIKKDSLLSHMVINAMSNLVARELSVEGKTEEGTVIDVKLTANGRELNLQSFVDHWQSQVERMIKEEANEILGEKIAEMSDEVENKLEEIKNKLIIL